MGSLRSILILAVTTGAMGTSDTMGPAAFMWPPDRVWSGEMDNTAPCGSVASVTNRTAFPITGGKVSFTAQDDSYNAQLSIAFKNDPQTQSDFSYILTTVPISEIDPGHTCFSIADPPPSTPEGTNATIQIKYTADFDRPENQTFYACADITYVAAANFNSADILCFNATDDEDVPAPTATGTPTNLPGHGAAGPPLDTPESDAQSGSESAGAGGLSKGGIAGAVVGSVLGVALIAGLAFLFYRERQKKMRLVAQRDSGRGVKWVEEPGKDSVSADTIRMGNMS